MKAFWERAQQNREKKQRILCVRENEREWSIKPNQSVYVQISFGFIPPKKKKTEKKQKTKSHMLILRKILGYLFHTYQNST